MAGFIEDACQVHGILRPDIADATGLLKSILDAGTVILTITANRIPPEALSLLGQSTRGPAKLFTIFSGVAEEDVRFRHESRPQCARRSRVTRTPFFGRNVIRG